MLLKAMLRDKKLERALSREKEPGQDVNIMTEIAGLRQSAVGSTMLADDAMMRKKIMRLTVMLPNR